MSTRKQTGTYSEEILTHFRCGVCDRWWSIGDIDMKETKELFCPWCGEKQTFEKHE